MIRGKDPEPSPLRARSGVSELKRIRQHHARAQVQAILLVSELGLTEPTRHFEWPFCVSHAVMA